MKSFFESKTVIFSAFAILAKMWGFKTGDAQNAYELINVLWPVILGIFADITAMIQRIRQSEFHANWGSSAFWMAIISGLCTIVGAFGVDITALQGILQKGLDNGPAWGALTASLVAIWGAVTASKPIAPKNPNLTLMLPFLLVLTGSAFADSPPTLARVVSARVIRVIDGDTFKADVDLGFGVALVNQSVRLANVHAIELHDTTTDEGKAEAIALANILPNGSVVLITYNSTPWDKYHRVLGTVWKGDVCVNAEMKKLPQGGR